MDLVQKNLLEQVAGLHEVPEGAYNIRANGKKAARNTTANIDIVTKEDKDGIDIIIKPGTVNESVHIPVVLSESGLQECVYNDFYIGEGADVTIVAGCGIHNCGVDTSKHEGIHTFYLEKNAKVKYIERHYGEGDGNGENVMNPQTIVHLKEGAHMEMPRIEKLGGDLSLVKDLPGVMALLKSREPTLQALAKAAMLFCHNNPVDASSLPAQLKDKEDASFEAMAAFVRKAPTIEWKKENIYGLMKEIMDEQGVKVLHLAIPLRVLVTGAEKTPSIDATLELYGQERVLTRLNEGMEKWAAQRAGN